MRQGARRCGRLNSKRTSSISRLTTGAIIYNQAHFSAHLLAHFR
jgi:hypothetical protein